MQNTSTSYKTEIKKPSRSFECRITIGKNIYLNEDIVDIVLETPQPTDGYTIGGTTSQTLDLTLINKGEVIYSTNQIKVEIGLKIGGTIEYILMGLYNIDDVIKTDYTTKFIAFDNMMKFETPYFSNLGNTSTLQEIVNELTTMTGVQFTGSLPSYNLNKLEGFTCREILSYVASISGGNAFITREGKFTIVVPKDITYTINADNYIDYKREETNYKVGKVSCQVGEKIIEKGSLGTDSMDLQFENPWVTESIINDIYNKVKAIEYLGYTMKWQGDLSLDIGDIITCTDVKGIVRKLPILSQKLTYTGGLTSEIGAKGETKNKNSFSSSGSNSNKVNRVVTELLIANEALINKANIKDLEATNIRTQTLEAKTAKIETSIIDVAYITDLNVINGRINNLIVEDARINTAIINKAEITDLNAVKGNITSLTSDIANINTLLAGNITGGNIQAGGITSDKLTIKNGFITNLMVANIDVSKINAGDISTNKFRIKSDNGGIEIVGSTQQFKDKNNKVRIQMGQDAQGDFNFILRGEDGTTILIDHTGIKKGAIANDLIIKDMIATDAIGERQIDYNSFATGFNKDTNTNIIKSSKVQLDGTNQTLNVAFNSLKTEVQNIEVGGRNLIIRSGEKTDTMVGQSGDFPPYVGSSLMDNYIEVTPSKSLMFSQIKIIGNDDHYFRYAFYKADKITMIVRKANDSNSFLEIVPENAKYLRVAYSSKNKVKLENGNKVTDFTIAPEDTDKSIADVKEITVSNSTTIGVMQGQISTAINNTQIIKDGKIILLKDDYNRTVQTVNSTSETIGRHQSTIDANTGAITNVTTEVTEVKKSLTGITQRVGASETNITTVTTNANKGIEDARLAKVQADKGVADALLASNKATNAQNTANTASTNANTANTKLSDIASDSKLTESEKKIAKKEWDIIVSEKAKIESEGTKFGVSIADYTAKYNTLNTYITPLLTNLNATTDIVGVTFRLNFTNYYNARQDLLNAITSKAKVLADTAQTQANTGVTNANTAQLQANKGVADALLASNKAGQSLIDAKAYTNAEITTVTNKVTSANTEITQLKNQIALKIEATDITTAISNIQVGGRNLVKNSTFTLGFNGFDSWRNISGVSIINAESDKLNSKIIKLNASGLTTNSIKSLVSNMFTCATGDTLTFSIDIKVDNFSVWDIKAPFIVEFYDVSGVRIQYQDVYITNMGLSTMENGKWYRVTLVTKITNALVISGSIRPSLFRNGTLYMREPKVEIGNKATDWTPALEDVDKSIADTITITETKINQAKAEIKLETDRINLNVSSVDSKVTTAQTQANKGVTDAKGALDKANGVDGRVTTLNTTVTNTSSKVAGIETTLTSITNRVSATESATTKINGTITSMETRLKAAEVKITDSSIISTVQATINTAKTDAINSANTNTTNQLKSYSTTSQMNTAITQNASSVKAEVSNTYLNKTDAINTYATKASMELTTKQLKLDFTSSGGYNFVKNSNFQRGTAFWDKVGNPSTYAVGKYRANGYGENVLALTTTASGQQVSQLIEGLQIGRRYTVSCYIYIGTGSICIMEGNQWNGAYTKGTGWQWISFSFVPSVSNVVIFIGSNTTAPAGSCHITAVSVTEGSERLAWIPHTNEIYSGNTIIDADGIQYTHSDKTYTRMGKEGFAWHTSTMSHAYHCLTKVGVFNVASYGNGNWTKVKIQLPSYFKNKYFEPQCAIAGFEVGSAGVSIVTALIDSYNLAEGWFIIKVFGSNNSGGYFNNINVTWVVTA